MTRPRHHCGRYARVEKVWVGFGRSIKVLHCEPCERFERTTNQLRRERIEREQFNELLDWMCAAE